MDNQSLLKNLGLLDAIRKREAVQEVKCGAHTGIETLGT